jgi:hypothetical protein
MLHIEVDGVFQGPCRTLPCISLSLPGRCEHAVRTAPCVRGFLKGGSDVEMGVEWKRFVSWPQVSRGSVSQAVISCFGALLTTHAAFSGSFMCVCVCVCVYVCVCVCVCVYVCVCLFKFY